MSSLDFLHYWTCISTSGIRSHRQSAVVSITGPISISIPSLPPLRPLNWLICGFKLVHGSVCFRLFMIIETPGPRSSIWRPWYAHKHSPKNIIFAWGHNMRCEQTELSHSHTCDCTYVERCRHDWPHRRAVFGDRSRRRHIPCNEPQRYSDFGDMLCPAWPRVSRD